MKKILIAAAVALLPLTTNAAFGGVRSMIEDALDIVNLLIRVSVAVALLVFFWGLVKFIRSADNEKSHSEGRSLMIWGVISLFVIASVGGLVMFIQDELDIGYEDIDIIQVGGGDDGG